MAAPLPYGMHATISVERQSLVRVFNSRILSHDLAAAAEQPLGGEQACDRNHVDCVSPVVT